MALSRMLTVRKNSSPATNYRGIAWREKSIVFEGLRDVRFCTKGRNNYDSVGRFAAVTQMKGFKPGVPSMELPPRTAVQSVSPPSPTATQVAHNDTILTSALATSQSLRALVGLKLARLGLASGQDRLLIALADNDGLSVSALAEELNVRPSTVSKMMDRLTARGYTQRLQDATDARRINVQLTPDGAKICLQLRVLWDEIDAELTADLSPLEKARILEGLTLLGTQVGHRLRRLR